MNEPGTCDFHDDHDRVRDVPAGNRCGAPATHRIVWLDRSGRYSMACERHTHAIDEEAPPHEVEGLSTGKEREHVQDGE